MTKNQTNTKWMVLFLLMLSAGLWACSGCDDGGGQGDDGGQDPVELPDPTGDLDAVPDDVPADDAVAHEDVAADDVPADPTGDEEPSAITWTLTDLGVAADSYDIARDNNDQVHIIWKEAGAGRLLNYGRIETGTLVGSVEIPLTAGILLANKRPRLAVAPDGSTVHTAWVPPDWSRLSYVWRDSGGTWHDRETVWTRLSGGWSMAQPAIGADADGNVHIIAQYWCNESVGSCTGDEPQIAYWQKPVAGVWPDWTGIQPIDGNEWRQCDIAVDRYGGVHAAWKSMNNRHGHYCFAPSGGSLTGCEPVDIPVPDDATFVSCGSSFSTVDLVDGGDVYHVMWSLGTDYTIDLVSKPAMVNTFTVSGRPSLEAFPLDTGIDPWPVMGVDHLDRIFVSWVHANDADGTVDVYISIYVDGAWNRAIIDDDAGVDNDTRSVLAVTTTAAYLVWRAASGNLTLAMTEF